MRTSLCAIMVAVAFAVQVPSALSQTPSTAFRTPITVEYPDGRKETVNLTRIPSADSRAPITVEYLDGHKETVTWTRMTDSYIFVRTKTGGYNITATQLSDKTLQQLGMSGELRRREEQKRQEEFQKGQKEKGLIEFGGQWVTPTEKQNLIEAAEARKRQDEYIRQADELIMAKFRQNVPFQVLQPAEEGSLCVTGRKFSEYSTRYIYDGEIFFWLDANRSLVAQDEEFVCSFFWAGTYTYTTLENRERTVNGFTTDRELARATVMEKFGLYDKLETAATPPSPGRSPQQGATASREPQPSGFGSGFIVTEDGYIVSNDHVAGDATRIWVKTETELKEAKVVARDPDNDLALLKIDGSYIPVAFAEDRTAQLGQTVFTLGFPLPELQGFDPKVTKGVVSSLKGIQDDIRRYQIDAAVQPGNSGGPLADETGNIIGVVVARINDVYVMRGTGTLPQNVNYAVKKSYVLALLDNYPDVAKKIKSAAAPGQTTKFEDAVSRVRKSTVLVITY